MLRNRCGHASRRAVDLRVGSAARILRSSAFGQDQEALWPYQAANARLRVGSGARSRGIRCTSSGRGSVSTSVGTGSSCCSWAASSRSCSDTAPQARVLHEPEQLPEQDRPGLQGQRRVPGPLRGPSDDHARDHGPRRTPSGALTPSGIEQWKAQAGRSRRRTRHSTSSPADRAEWNDNLIRARTATPPRAWRERSSLPPCSASRRRRARRRLDATARRRSNASTRSRTGGTVLAEVPRLPPVRQPAPGPQAAAGILPRRPPRRWSCG